jgi:hypothetical protein
VRAVARPSGTEPKLKVYLQASLPAERSAGPGRGARARLRDGSTQLKADMTAALGLVTRLVLLAGPSGGGKSRLARLVGALPLRLDDFYRDADAPGLPCAPTASSTGTTPATWDAAARPDGPHRRCCSDGRCRRAHLLHRRSRAASAEHTLEVGAAPGSSSPRASSPSTCCRSSAGRGCP